METLGVIDYCRKFGVTRNTAAEKESESTQLAYLDDCSDAPYCRGA